MNTEKEVNCKVHRPEDTKEQTRTVLARKKGRAPQGAIFLQARLV